MNRQTRLVQRSTRAEEHHATAAPLFLSATFEQTQADRLSGYDYARTANPTRDELQDLMAQLEHGAGATAYSSGMAAIHAVLSTLRPGDRVVVGDDLYGGTSRLLALESERVGFDVTRCDLTDLSQVREALREPVQLVWVETPSNPLQQVVNIADLAQRCHRIGAQLAVDSTMMTPCLQQPLRLGADFVVHSATKFLAGHGDLMAGIVVTRHPEAAGALAHWQNAVGNGLAPFDSWLLLRGMKTLRARLAMQQQTCARVARWLQCTPEVQAVRWVGAEDHPGAHVHRRQAFGAPPLICFQMKDPAAALRLVQRTELFRTCVSFGSVTSTISIPSAMSHASTPGGATVSNRWVRISVGLEDADDLLGDLRSALPAHAAAAPKARRPKANYEAVAPGAL